MNLFRHLPLLLVVLTALATPASATGDALPPHRVLSEDLSEQRRQVSVRIEHRLKEGDLMRIGETIRARQARPFARTIVNFFLPGQDLQQGSWASVATTTDSKVTINGLRQEDEEVLIAEFNADKRHLLGSWLTSPPAAPGRLTVFSDEGKIFGEWRLRNGQRTVDELVDVSTRTERRFEVPGGSTYVLTRSGDLEIREKSALVATAERIHPQYLALPASVALGHSAPPALVTPAARPAAAPQQAPKPAVASVASPAQPEPAAVAPTDSTASAGPKLALPAPVETTEVQAAQAGTRPKPKGHASAKPKETRTRSAKSNSDGTPGDLIAGKLGRL